MMGFHVPLRLRCKPTYTGPGDHSHWGVRRFLDALAFSILMMLTGVGSFAAIQMLQLRAPVPWP